MGTLKVGVIDLNNPNVVMNIKNTIDQLVQIRSSYYSLRFNPNYYFEVPNGPLPSDKGWYIILEDREEAGKKPLYVGSAKDLNARLNTNNGSLDDFAKKGRLSDAERNFIKKFDQLKIVSNLKVCIITEGNLCLRLGINPNNLTDLDRGNIEKTINIFRGYFKYM